MQAVLLVKNIKTNKMTAVKVLQKAHLCKNQWTLDLVKREKSILMDLKGNKWFTELIFIKDSPNAVYLGLQYYGGGD